jgi:hypothetical protein
MVQLLNQVEENRFKIIENNIIKHVAFIWVYNGATRKFEKLWHNKNR